MKKLIVMAAGAAMLATSGLAYAAEPIEGTWLRPSTGTLVKYSKRGGRFCGIVQNGEFSGKSIGCMSGSGEAYKGEVIALDEDKTYSGKAKVTGNTMDLKGCVAGGLICRGEKWRRQ